MKLCDCCGTPLTRDEITYYETTCDACEAKQMQAMVEAFDADQRDRLEVDSQFDGLVETVIVKTKATG